MVSYFEDYLWFDKLRFTQSFSLIRHSLNTKICFVKFNLLIIENTNFFKIFFIFKKDHEFFVFFRNWSKQWIYWACSRRGHKECTRGSLSKVFFWWIENPLKCMSFSSRILSNLLHVQIFQWNFWEKWMICLHFSLHFENCKTRIFIDIPNNSLCLKIRIFVN